MRRQFNLPRWTRRQEFRDLRRAAVAWLDRHFELIERGAPWLNQVGSDVQDSCSAHVRGLIEDFFSPRPRATAGCARTVTAVYGFDDPLIARLRSLDQALATAGWELGGLAWQSWADLVPPATAAPGLARHKVRWMTDRQANLTWRPTIALDYPQEAERMRPWGQPPLGATMRVTWSSRGQETGWRRNPGETPERGVRTRTHLPLEISERTVPELLDEALARYEHALTVTIRFSYYSNENAKARPHRIPRYLLPAPRRRSGS
jgi:hypothetical protein